MKKTILLLYTSLTLCLSAFAAVDLNTASQSDLETLPGIGPSKAKAIIDYRKQHGGFESKADLMEVDGIGPGTLKRLSSDISVRKKNVPVPAKGSIPSSINY